MRTLISVLLSCIDHFIMFKFHTNEFEIVQIVSVMHEDIMLSETNETFTKEPVSSIRYNLACAPIEDSNLTAHPRSLIRVFDGRSMGRQESNSYSDCADVHTDFNRSCTTMWCIRN